MPETKVCQQRKHAHTKFVQVSQSIINEVRNAVEIRRIYLEAFAAHAELQQYKDAAKVMRDKNELLGCFLQELDETPWGRPEYCPSCHYVLK